VGIGGFYGNGSQNMGIHRGLGAFVFFAIGRGQLNEVEVVLTFLTATVALGCAGIIEAIGKHGREKLK